MSIVVRIHDRRDRVVKRQMLRAGEPLQSPPPARDEVSGPLASIVIVVARSHPAASPLRAARDARLRLNHLRNQPRKHHAIHRQRMPRRHRARIRACSSSEPARRISCFSSHGAVFSLSDFSEFEHTSSAKSAVWCASVDRCGRISYSSTSQPSAPPAAPPPAPPSRRRLLNACAHFASSLCVANFAVQRHPRA